jgi:hypothetical protein
MSSIVSYPKESGYYFALGRIFILADHPNAAELVAKCPDCPVVNQKALDLITELTQSKATAEAKVLLLKKAIESL